MTNTEFIFSVNSKDIDFLLDGIKEYNEMNFDHYRVKNLGEGIFGYFALYENEYIGGIYGKLDECEWLNIEVIFIKDNYKFLKTEGDLIDLSIKYAQKNNARGVFFNTWDKNLKDICEQEGFVVFGEIADYPLGETNYFMKKIL